MKKISEVEKLLKDWNGGVLREAKTRLAKELKVQTGNVSNWIHGRQEPSERALVKMAKLFGKKEEEIRKAFGFNKNKPIIQQNLKNKDCHIQQIINAAEAEVLKTQMKVIETKLDLIIQILKGGNK